MERHTQMSTSGVMAQRYVQRAADSIITYPCRSSPATSSGVVNQAVTGVFALWQAACQEPLRCVLVLNYIAALGLALAARKTVTQSVGPGTLATNSRHDATSKAITESGERLSCNVCSSIILISSVATQVLRRTQVPADSSG